MKYATQIQPDLDEIDDDDLDDEGRDRDEEQYNHERELSRIEYLEER